METLDKTMFTNNEEDLQKIYEEEAKKLQNNQRKMEILKKLSLEDFPRDLPESSKKNIEKALLAIRIRDHITMENGQKVLGEWRIDGFCVGFRVTTKIHFRTGQLRCVADFPQLQRKETRTRAL
jgi:hypothetical protein